MTRQISRELEGNTTEIVVQTFADRILVLVTQLGKVGNLVGGSVYLPSPPASIQLTPLLGNAPSQHVQTLHSLYAAQIATILWTVGSSNPLEVSRKSVVVGIALRRSDENEDGGLTENERIVFAGVMSMILELVAGAPK
ncbi:hypothetical protein C8R44DRAFT_713558 [Mycena epipterygia]|nr:hypothetical protein C8R44DRAFT_713558 [Mycena epipterygia]